MEEILTIEQATIDLWQMCLQAVQHIIDNKLYDRFHIPIAFVPYVEQSWSDVHPALYGRFDLCYRDGQVKRLEFNAGTPTSLFEAGIIQWFWLQDFDKHKDQFNSIYEKLIETLIAVRSYLYPGPYISPA